MKMRRYIIASHGRFAQGIYESVEMILGKQTNVEIINCYIDGTDIKQLIKEKMDSIPEGEDVIIATDIFGGSVNNEFMKYIDRKNVHVLTGMNLPLLVQLFLSQKEDTKEMIEELIHNSGTIPKYCNEYLVNKGTCMKEEDF